MLAKRWLLGLLGALLLTLLPALAATSYAHAVLVRSEPAANATLSESPHEIRLWFAEQLEADYSTIELRNDKGALVPTPPSYLDPADAGQMVLMTGELPPGLYTAVWRNVSAADGHGVSGSIPFIVGESKATATTASADSGGLTAFDLFSRWVNLLGVALAVGSIAFVVFVWQPATRTLTPALTLLSERPLWVVVWVGWVAAGVGGALLLLNQAAILLNKPVSDLLNLGVLWHVISDTRFGSLWLERMGLWLVMGGLLLAGRRSAIFAWLATACGLLMLLPISMFSHAAASSDMALSIFSDWVHLAMMALWVGGLAQFLVAIPILRAQAPPVAPKLGLLVATFSNYARITVVALIVTGLYATWNLVTTWEGLTTTFYGQLLLVKLALAVVLLAVAGVNLVWTQSRLLAGQSVWVGRLRGLVSMEVLLTFAILLVVGAMTAINPARNEIAQREAAAAAIPQAPAPQPIMSMAAVDDLHIMLSTTPGWVGTNTFTVQITDEAGNPITDASLIRMRFEDQTEKLGESELKIRPEAEVPDGLYTIDGANLSAVGEWRIRMTIQRPDEYDSVADFAISAVAQPKPVSTPIVASNPILPNRTPVLLLAGILAVLAGLYALIEQRKHLWQGSSLLASLLVILGAAFLLTGFLT